MKIGDYVRTEDGIIAKIIDNIENPYKEKTIFVLDKEININDLEGADIYSIFNPFAEETTNKIDTHFQDEKIIIKSSPNIIDLIEVGDIVNYEQLNGGVVLNKKDDSIDTWSILPNSLKNEDIKSVITKEQLKNCMYEVGE